jgi:hypothetical protein
MMNVPVEIVALFAGAMLALQGWTLATVVALVKEVAVLKKSLGDCQGMHGLKKEKNP